MILGLAVAAALWSTTALIAGLALGWPPAVLAVLAAVATLSASVSYRVYRVVNRSADLETQRAPRRQLES